jgi:hypothetical protein
MQHYSRQVLIATDVAGCQDNIMITCLVSWKCVDRRGIHEFPSGDSYVTITIRAPVRDIDITVQELLQYM